MDREWSGFYQPLFSHRKLKRKKEARLVKKKKNNNTLTKAKEERSGKIFLKRRKKWQDCLKSNKGSEARKVSACTFVVR